MLQNKIKGQCNKQLKSSCKLVINILFKDINNNLNLLYIREINLNCIQKCCYFNALINLILINKEPENKYKDKVKKVKQEVNYLKKTFKIRFLETIFIFKDILNIKLLKKFNNIIQELII